MKHHAIVVSSFDSEAIANIHDFASDLFDTMVTSVQISPVNGYSTFFIGPDGSKEGWNESNDYDARRKLVITEIDSIKYDDGSNRLSYSEFFYGEDNNESQVVSHN